MSVEFLRRLELFSGVAEADLNWLIEQARPVTVEAGGVLIEEGTPGDSLYIIEDGAFEVLKRSGQQDIAIAVREPGAVIGEMSLLDNSPRMASVRATQESHLLMIPHEAFHQMLTTSPSAAMAILKVVSSRLRQNEGLLRQSEKMAALGTLSAGLAHELNNPAAAVKRSAAQLGEALTTWQGLSSDLEELATAPGQRERVRDLRDEIARRAAQAARLDPLARSDREGELQTWLEDRGVDEAWELAPTLVNFGWEAEELERLAVDFSDEALPVLMRWLAAGCSINGLLTEVGMAAERISEIVRAVKSYSYLDQAPIQEVDLHEGLENTLVILRHKLKQAVKVTKDYAPALPRIEAYGSELNQVWTNILDNAIDAMKGEGELTLRTYQKNEHVVVELADTGPGIPPEVQPRIFEAFFTTKPPGVGTGLGLNIAYTIVNKHNGLIQVTSRPGATCFQVTLPIRLKSR
ncbi:MAG: cyclic nucleotide-binding domain-containing protein [Chloroflexi bacterium]|nr:cyclic nucleotide-binding domain-containing protein [Chloroflexota bacterium]